MKLCNECRKSLPDDAKFCNKCGADQTKKRAAQSESAKSGATEKDCETTIAVFNQEINRDPNNASAYMYRGMEYFIKKDYENAIRDLNKAIKLNPNLAKAYVYRGATYLRYKENSSKAIRDLNKAIKLDLNLTNAYLYRSIAYAEKGVIDKAFSDIDDAISLF